MSMNFKPGQGLWVLGASFLHNYMAIFDYDNMRVGFYGVSEKETVPWTVIEYLILFSLALLGLTFVDEERRGTSLCARGQTHNT